MAHVKWLHLPCHVCGEELNTWDMRISHALGYEHITCERCVAKEYGLSVPEVRKTLEEHFGLQPCQGI